MNTTIRILGLGLDSILWKRLTHQLTEAFSKDQIELSFSLIKYKWSHFKENSLSLLNEFQPDFIFSSTALFKNLEEMEAFFQTYQPADLVDYPCLILIEKDSRRFIKQFLKLHPYSEFQFKQYPRLRIDNPDWFADGSKAVVQTDLQPTPELILPDRQTLFLDRDKLVGFASWHDLTTIGWNGKQYSPKDFCDWYDRTYQPRHKASEFKGLLFDCGRVFLSPGFFLRDIVKIETDYLPIMHIISFQQLKASGPDFEALLFKLLETAKFRSGLRFNEDYFNERAVIKSHVPVTISADSAVICSLFRQLLQHDGYINSVTADQTVDSAVRFLISLHYAPDHNTPFSYAIVLDKAIAEFEGIEQLDATVQLTDSELEDLVNAEQIQKRKHQLAKRLSKLDDQFKMLSSSKAKTDKERYVDMITQGKMEVIKNLLEVSEIWDEHSCDVSVSRQENVLVLYDQPSQAQLIETQLQHNNRKLYLDASQQLVTLEALVNLNTGQLEPFLHDGVVICCMSTKAVLIRRFQQFVQELSQKKYPPLDEAIATLKTEISRCKNRIKHLKLLELGSRLYSVFQANAEALYNEIQVYFKELERNRYSIKNGSKICVVADNEDECQKIRSVLEQLASNCSEITFHLVHSQLDLTGESMEEIDSGSLQAFFNNSLNLGQNEQEVIRHQAQVLSRYYRSLFSKIAMKDVDLFILNGDQRIFQVLIEFLRQEKSKYQQTPIVLLASGTFDYNQMRELSRNGVKVLYQDQFRRDNPQELSLTFKTLFSLF